ncbi:MAG TPA: hypothetical protein VHQ45_19455, partial [Gemmatimonadaceae bacterium]|nr:hypothetical protein [Gemmatimonadaceae bacterium]
MPPWPPLAWLTGCIARSLHSQHRSTRAPARALESRIGAMASILGISAFYHDSAACLLRDGEIVAAAQ